MPQIRLLLMFALGMFMAVSIPVAAQAQDDDSDTDDEAGSEVDQPTTEEDERSSSSDSRRSARSEDDERDAEDILTEDDRRRRRIIKVVQKKHFLKMNRLEVTPQFALMPSDFFLRRYIFGANIAFHISEIFSAEVLGGYSPNLGEADRAGRHFPHLGDISAQHGNVTDLWKGRVGEQPYRQLRHLHVVRWWRSIHIR